MSRARLRETATFILIHLDNEDMKDELDQPQFSQNGPEIFDHIMNTCLQALTAAEIMEVKTELSQMSIKHTVGSSENSVNLLLQALRAMQWSHLLVVAAAQGDHGQHGACGERRDGEGPEERHVRADAARGLGQAGDGPVGVDWG